MILELTMDTIARIAEAALIHLPKWFPFFKRKKKETLPLAVTETTETEDVETRTVTVTRTLRSTVKKTSNLEGPKS
jgi:hypothetical protein